MREQLVEKPPPFAREPFEWRAPHLEHAPSPLAVLEGSDHRVRYANLAFCRLLDRTAEAIAGKAFSELLPDESDCAALLDRVYLSAESESHREQDFSSALTFWSYTLWPVVSAGHAVGVVIQVTETAKVHEEAVAMNEALMIGAVRQHELAAAAAALNLQLAEEIDRRRQVEDSLHRAQAQLSARAGELEEQVLERTSELTGLNQQLEAFVYSIAHDLRAPLRAMQGFSTLLLEESSAVLSDTSKDYVDRIGRSARAMDFMLKDLLAFGRVSRQRVEVVPVRLEQVVESVLLGLRSDIREKGARVERPGPWPTVLADEPILNEVVLHLVKNALIFSAPGVAPQLRLRAEAGAEFVRVWVEDNGIGIAPEHHEQIFRLFARLHGELHRGTGAGLAIVRQGVTRMGGRLGVESALGQGSRFWFELRKA